MPYATLPDGELWYERAGSTGPRVLLVMGLGMRGIAWRFQIEALAEAHQVVWYDGRGVGNTKAPVEGLRMSGLAADAIALLDHLGWPDAHVAGISMGGMVSQHIALEHRARVRSLALIATHPGGARWLVPPPRGLLGFVIGQLAPGRHRLGAVSRLLYTREYLRSVDRTALHAELTRGLGPKRPTSDLGAQIRAIMSHDTRQRLTELGGLSTLVVRPGRDRLIDPRASDHLHALIPGATLLAIPVAGHGVMRERSEAVNAGLVRHIGAAEAAAD